MQQAEKPSHIITDRPSWQLHRIGISLPTARCLLPTDTHMPPSHRLPPAVGARLLVPLACSTSITAARPRRNLTAFPCRNRPRSRQARTPPEGEQTVAF